MREKQSISALCYSDSFKGGGKSIDEAGDQSRGVRDFPPCYNGRKWRKRGALALQCCQQLVARVLKENDWRCPVIFPKKTCRFLGDLLAAAALCIILKYFFFAKETLVRSANLFAARDCNLHNVSGKGKIGLHNAYCTFGRERVPKRVEEISVPAPYYTFP